MSRIEPLEAPYSEEVLASFAKLMPPGMEPLKLFRVLGHNPRVLRRIQRGGLLDPGAVSLRLRELVILRTCALCSGEYEWGVHATLFAPSAELDDTSRDQSRHRLGRQRRRGGQPVAARNRGGAAPGAPG